MAKKYIIIYKLGTQVTYEACDNRISKFCRNLIHESFYLFAVGFILFENSACYIQCHCDVLKFIEVIWDFSKIFKIVLKSI